jgi:nitroreductase
MNTILEHRSVRNFKSESVPQNILKNILKAGTRASTTGNMQVYSMVVTQDVKIKNDLWEAHFKQDMVKKAPVVITFCADFNRFNKWCEQRNAVPGYDNFLSFYTASIDALLAAQNVALAAEDNGLGICYLGTTTYMAEKIIDILELPKFVVPVTTIVLGFPTELPELTDRLPVEGVVHFDTYTDYTAEQIDNLYAEKEAMELTKQLLKENKKETLAQVFTDNRYTKKDNVGFSQALLKVLEKQGFMNNL